MIKIENGNVWGFEHAIRGMRNPMNSHDKSDSEYRKGIDGMSIDASMANNYQIGKNDLDLMKRLYKAGPEHRKYMRQIFVSMDVVAPLYWWKEFDTYKVGTVSNSCSTMHKIAAKEFTLDDFSHEHLVVDKGISFVSVLTKTIAALNTARERYNETKDKEYWWQMIQLLPSSYNQRRTVTMNYENVIGIIKQRTGHKLDEWNVFVEVLKGLPYVEEIMK